jgi:hypothetical protein
MLPQAVEFRISDAAGIARIPTAIDPGGAVLVSGTLARLQDRWKVGECSRSSKHDCGTRATYWHKGLNGAFSLCPWLLDLKLTSCRDLPLSLDYKTTKSIRIKTSPRKFISFLQCFMVSLPDRL